MFWYVVYKKMEMNMIMVSMFLPLLLMMMKVIIPVTSRLNSVRVTSYKVLRKTKNGPAMCALEKANESISSSSLQDCSLKCARGATCTGFNIKNSVICDVYNFKPLFTYLVSDCEFHQVAIISDFPT